MNIQKFIVNSNNWSAGREGHPISGIVLHTMVGTWQGAQGRFNDPSSQVSVTYGVGLDGSVHQWVEEKDTAYQAGNWDVNLKTIGIEHEDNGNYDDPVRTDALYASSAQLVADICKRYGFPADHNHIFLHKNVIDKSRYPGGTACPDGLDTERIIREANKLLGGDVEKSINRGDLVNLFRELIGREPNNNDYEFHLNQPDASWNRTIYDLLSRPDCLLKADANFVEDCSVGTMGRTSVGDKDLQNNIGSLVRDCLRTFVNYPEAKKFRTAATSDSKATVLKPGKYQVN